MARINDVIPAGLTAEEWDAAYRRVWAYLTALGVRHEFQLHLLVQQVMERCAVRLSAGPAQHAVQVATDETERLVLDWFQAVLGIAPSDVAAIGDPAQLSLRGRLAMLLADMPAPEHNGIFLSDPPWPEAFVRLVRASYVEAVPALRLGQVTSPPLALGLVPQLADRALRTMDRLRWLRVLLLWGLFAAFFGFVFWLTR